MVIVKASEQSEAGRMSREAPNRDGKFTKALVKAGVMLVADGLHASS